MKEQIRIFVCDKCGGTSYTTDGCIPGACTQPFAVRTSGICAGHYSEVKGADFDWVISAEVERRIAEMLPSEEEILQYFNNHFNCYTETIDEVTELAMTNVPVLTMFKWFRSRMEGGGK